MRGTLLQPLFRTRGLSNNTTTFALARQFVSGAIQNTSNDPAHPLNSTTHTRPLHTSRPHQDSTTSTPKPSSGISSDLKTFSSSLESAATHTSETISITDLRAPHVGVIRILSLNRPKARNAISKQLLKALEYNVEQIHAQGPAGKVRVLVIASEVDESFCAGADLKERKGMEMEEVALFLARLRSTFTRLSTLPIPTISAISGTALGGGLELALCTHLRVISSNALLALPETRLGIIPGAGGTYRLPTIIGTARALDLMLTGRRVGAAEAVTMGLANAAWKTESEAEEERLLDPHSKRLFALSRAVEVANQVAQGGPLALEAVLRAVQGPGGPSEIAENVAYDSILHTEDRVEALRAFEEKRGVMFKGR